VMVRAANMSRRGHAVVEAALLSPWLLLLFAAVFDFGFYAYSLIAVQNAARVAALATASSPAARTVSVACPYVLQELQRMPNASALPAGCNAPPLTVSVTAFTDAEGKAASRVTVTYQTVQLIPLPWLPGRLTINRSAEMRVYGE
jgi:Flp pilus assembly protein TadG